MGENAPLRCGYTTGACAAAAARAAVRALLTARPVAEIAIDLPARPHTVFHVDRCEMDTGSVTCGVIKDAGDDPDITDGMELRARGGAVALRLRLPAETGDVPEVADSVTPGLRRPP